MKQFLLAVLSGFVLFSCDKDENEIYKVNIDLQCAETMPSNAKVVITNQSSSHVTTATLTDGAFSASLEPGIYSFQASAKGVVDNQMMVFNGLVSDVTVSGNTTVTITVSLAAPGNIVLREIYYTGCVGGDGKNYLNDQYFALYNNSTDTAYLDNICIAFVSPTTAVSAGPWSDFDKYDYCGAFRFVWAFPGNGSELPLLPGKEVIVSANSIDHIALGNTESVNLAKENSWAAYKEDAGLNKQTPPANGIPCMDLVWKSGTMTMFSSSFKDPAVVIYRPDIPMSQYANDYTTTNPASSSDKFEYLKIPHKWIIDGVEVFNTANSFKRIPASVDASYILNKLGIASRTSVCRKVDEKASAEAGLTIYQDTNNSAEDFEILTTPSLIK